MSDILPPDCLNNVILGLQPLLLSHQYVQEVEQQIQNPITLVRDWEKRDLFATAISLAYPIPKTPAVQTTTQILEWIKDQMVVHSPDVTSLLKLWPTDDFVPPKCQAESAQINASNSLIDVPQTWEDSSRKCFFYTSNM